MYLQISFLDFQLFQVFPYIYIYMKKMKNKKNYKIDY